MQYEGSDPFMLQVPVNIYYLLALYYSEVFIAWAWNLDIVGWCGQSAHTCSDPCMLSAFGFFHAVIFCNVADLL